MTQEGRFGPNTGAAERLLAALSRLGTAEVLALASVGSGNLEDPAARQTVRDGLPAIARGAHRMDAIRAMSDEVERWATSVRHWFPAGVAGSSQNRDEMEWRLAAVRAVLDAGYAVVLADQLRPDKVELLLGRWLDVVGDPFSDPVPDGPDGPYQSDEPATDR